MAGTRTYLDHNASAPLRPEVAEAMASAHQLAGNPSSVHAEGRQARTVIDQAREQVARLAGVAREDVIFTSGGTEANNAVLANGWKTIICLASEHDSVLAPARSMADGNGCSLHLLPVDANGVADLDRLRQLLGRVGGNETLLAVQAANSETGVVQPLVEIADLAHAAGVILHCDSVQAAGRLALDALGADTLSLSAHKIGGPKGVGALIVSNAAEIAPLLRGGGQEGGRRAGTENISGIAGFGVAADLARESLDRMAGVETLRDRLEMKAIACAPGAEVIGADTARLGNTSAIALEGANAETLVIAFDLDGIAISAGSACSSGKVTRSHVLDAMGIAPELAQGAIRVSLGFDTTNEDIDRFLDAWSRIINNAVAAPERAVA